MHDLSTIEIIASIVATWVIGLAPPLLIRYVILKRPVARWSAVGLCVVFWFLNIALFVAMGSKSKSHMVLTLVAFVSFFILRAGSKAPVSPEQSDAEDQKIDPNAKGECPNCNAEIPLASTQCPNCRAMFTSQAGWKIKPL